MAGSPPKPPPPTLAAGSSSSLKPPPTLAAGSSSSLKPPPTLAAGSSSSPKPPPPNFYSHPSYGELIDSYLRPRVVSRTKESFIHEADLYSADPNLLTSNYEAATSSNGETAWYFFTPLHPKGSAKNQMKRIVDTGRKGTWVEVGRPMDVRSNGQLIGKRRGFAFEEKVGGKLVKSAWRMMELRLNPNEGGQEAGSSELLALCKVYPIPKAKAEDESSMVVTKADAEAPAASAAVTPGREDEGADEEIAAETAAGPVRKKRMAGDKDSGAETVASSPGRQKKADGEIESADAATTGEIFADSKDPLDAPLVDKEQRRLPTRIGSAKSSAILEKIRLQKSRQPSQLQRGGSDSGEPQVSGNKNEVSYHRYCQTNTVSSRISSACDSKLELDNVNPSAHFKKPLPMSPREPIRFHFARRLSVLDKRGALDPTNEYATSEPRLPETGSSLLTWEGVGYTTTLGPGGGYGYPHPPPFYRCERCRVETALYRLKCCHRVVCECCGCACEPTEAGEGKRLQYQREKLPKVKLEGSDLFLWQPCSFPDGQMLWMAKRTENHHLQYYFSPIKQLMEPEFDQVEVCIYEFHQQGQNVISLSITDHLFERNLLRL